MKHYFSKEPKVKQLFLESNTLREWQKALNKLAPILIKEQPERYRSINPDDDIAKIKGDAFEVFCELFVNILGIHPHIGIDKYEPTEEGYVGIDAFGVNLENERCAIQCKYMEDPTHELTSGNSNIANFPARAEADNIHWGVVTKHKKLFLITTGAGLNYQTIENYRNRIFIINNKTIKKLVDKNLLFWRKCIELLT